MTKEEDKEKDKEKKEEDKKQNPEEGKEPEGTEPEKELTAEEKAQVIKERQEEALKREKGEEKPPETPSEPKTQKPPEKKEEEEKDDFWDKDEEDDEPEEDKVSLSELEKLVDAKVSPILEKEKNRQMKEKVKSRENFFQAHPQYLTNAQKWQTLLDEMDNFDPNSNLDYSVLLEKAHRIVDGASENERMIEEKKQEMASGASGGGEGNQTIIGDEKDSGGLTAEDKKIAKQWNVSEETMKEMKKRQQEGRMTISSSI